jgi:hypothetical protein
MNLNEQLTVLVGEENSINSPNTRAVAASLVCGGRLRENDGYVDTVEQGRDGKPRRKVVWLLADQEITLAPFAGETLSQAELLKRWNDKKWLAANPEHPVTHMRCLVDQLDILRDFINSRPSFPKLTRGAATAVIEMEYGADGKPVPTARGRAMMKQFENL